MTATVRAETNKNFSGLTEEERSHYCDYFAGETGSYAEAWEKAVLEAGQTEYSTYGMYAEYTFLDRCYGEGYVGAAAGGLAGIGDNTLGEAPESTCLIKGNISFNTGERIYHVPGQEYYEDTVINEDAGERWFCTEREALDAGWRKSKV